MIFSRFRLLIGLLGCFLAANPVESDSVEIVTPEVSITTTDSVSSVTPVPVVPRATVPVSREPFEKPPPGRKAFRWPSNDTYIQAYVRLHSKSPSKRNDQYGVPESSYNTVIRSSALPENKYPSLTQDWSSSRPTTPIFPSSVPTYGTYGSYHHFEDIHPTSHWHNRPYSSPALSLASLLPKKFTLTLLFKIVLKLILFKMIVKFIAVICLLLFIPVLKPKSSHGGMNDEDDDMRKMQKMNQMTEMIWNSIVNNELLYIGKDEGGQQEEEHEDKEELRAEEEELIYIRKIAEEIDKDPPTSGFHRAIVFLRYCVQAVERIAGFMHRRLRNSSHSYHWVDNLMKRMISFIG